jgi:alkylation response protein AidB-like acyl-CoA dehydrogenase
MLNPDAPLVTISKHPDVKRMLLWMKSHLEGQRILCYYLYKNIDLANIAPDETARKEAQALVEILTPICKAGCTDKGVEINQWLCRPMADMDNCRDYPIVRYMCDSKILAIWEGTNGVQSMDLTIRKILMNKDQYN